MLGPCSGSHGLHSRCRLGCVLIRRLDWEGSASELTLGVDRIYVLMAEGQRASLSHLVEPRLGPLRGISQRDSPSVSLHLLRQSLV